MPSDTPSLHDRFKNALTKRYFIRLHMTVMIGLVVLSGALASRMLVHLGVTNMAIRYPVAVTVSYLMFFVLVRIWIRYIAKVSASGQAARSGHGGSVDLGDAIPNNLGFSRGSGSGGAAESLMRGGGGSSGGAGASASFGEGQALAPRAVAIPVGSPRSGSSGSGFSLDLDGDGVWLLILFALLVCAIFGAGAYVIYQAPAILPEAAFQVALAPGLVKTARNSHEPGWMESVLKKTAIPFAIVLVLSGVFGWRAHKTCPGASTFRQAFSQCVFHPP